MYLFVSARHKPRRFPTHNFYTYWAPKPFERQKMLVGLAQLTFCVSKINLDPENWTLPLHYV
jgi:hypothetical protein